MFLKACCIDSTLVRLKGYLYRNNLVDESGIDSTLVRLKYHFEGYVYLAKYCIT